MFKFKIIEILPKPSRPHHQPPRTRINPSQFTITTNTLRHPLLFHIPTRSPPSRRRLKQRAPTRTRRLILPRSKTPLSRIPSLWKVPKSSRPSSFLPRCANRRNSFGLPACPTSASTRTSRRNKITVRRVRRAFLRRRHRPEAPGPQPWARQQRGRR